ncbi:LysR family transcriptional regulator [Pseudomonas sp. GL-RE-29]|uniref:LysR family transcriptional regulator n=1 Tax=Pseudomonas TaxID=286 RepID=UPI001CBACA17|nr:LysR family transcriptional regulator [Pseudomonas sp. GL-RE-29]
MQISQIRCFVAVATELHFAKAAALLNMTQPPLTRQIQLLEHSLGVTLFERNRRSVRLTASGRAFLPEAHDILRKITTAEIAARRASSGGEGTVNLGFIPAASCFLPMVISATKAKLPNVDLVLKEMQSIDQLEALSANKIDLGLIRPISQRPDVQSDCVLTESFVLAIPASHPLAGQDLVRVVDLDQQPFIMYSPSEGRYSYEMLAGPFRAAACAPRYVQYINRSDSMLYLVSAAMGLAIVPISAVREHFQDVVYKPLDLGDAHAQLHLARRTTSHNPITEGLREVLTDAFHMYQQRRPLM